jgi:hypothetical protein
VDFYKFVLPTAGVLDIRVIPTGDIYPNAPQSGGCPQGVSINSFIVHNLAFELRDINGTTILTTVNSVGAGSTESLEDFSIPAGGTYYLRVFATTTTSDIQLYRLEMNFAGVGCPGDANGDNTVDFSDLNIVIFQFNSTGVGLIGDLNDDGIVDFSDLNLVLSNYNQSCSPARPSAAPRAPGPPQGPTIPRSHPPPASRRRFSCAQWPPPPPSPIHLQSPELRSQGPK